MDRPKRALLFFPFIPAAALIVLLFFQSQASAQANPDLQTRQNYELTHTHSWTDFRVLIARAIAGYESYRRGITEPVNLSNGCRENICGFYYQPHVTSLDEANQILQSVYDNICANSSDTTYYIPFDEAGNACGGGWTGMASMHHSGIGLIYALADQERGVTKLEFNSFMIKAPRLLNECLLK